MSKIQVVTQIQSEAGKCQCRSNR